jgi:VanZ family protein
MKFIKLWVPVFVWAGLIFYLSSIPQLTTGWGVYDLVLRKIAHITEYFILVLLLYRAFRGSFNLTSFYLLFWSSILSFLYAVSDEIHQAFVPTREARIGDVLIDTLGIIIFFMLIKYKKKFSEKIMF